MPQTAMKNWRNDIELNSMSASLRGRIPGATSPVTAVHGNHRRFHAQDLNIKDVSRRLGRMDAWVSQGRVGGRNGARRIVSGGTLCDPRRIQSFGLTP